jgi:putative DNA primase/helicase
MITRNDISEQARNRWQQILAALGINPEILRGKHAPCPLCGGKDRFRFNDWHGKGRWLCNHCTQTGGDGFNLLMSYHGWTFTEAAEQIRHIICGGAESWESRLTKAQPKPMTGSDAKRNNYAQFLWRKSEEVTAGNPVDKYLIRRTQIQEMPNNIRYMPELDYKTEVGNKSTYPAMITRVQDLEGKTTAIHRTYLTNEGEKADVPNPKQVSGVLPPGSAVRLCIPKDKLGIAEGIETALSAAGLFQIPVWAALSANGLARWVPPKEIRQVLIFADNDETGRTAAERLHKSLNDMVDVTIELPTGNKDWNDVQMSSLVRQSD